MNLRDLKATDVRPQEQIANPSAGYAGTVGAGLNALANTAQALRTEKAVADKAAKAFAADTALGEAANAALDISFNSLTDNVVAEMEAAATEDNVTLGTSGRRVLRQAYDLSKIEEHLQSTGQMNTLQQIRLIRKQQALIATRPDLGEDIVRVTNAAAADANALLKQDEDARETAIIKRRDEEAAAYKAVLVEANDYDPRDTVEVQRKKAGVYMYDARRKGEAADALLALEQRHKAQGFMDAAGDRADKETARTLVQKELLPSEIVGISRRARSMANSGMKLEEAEAQWEEARALSLADAAALIKDPTELNAYVTQVNAAYDRNKPFATGKTRVEQMQRESLVNETQAKLTLQNVDGGNGAFLLEFMTAAGPAFGDLLGEAGMQDKMSTTLGALWQSATARGLAGEDTEVKGSGIPNPRAGRQFMPDPSASSPYLEPDQRPSTVTDAQVRQGTNSLMLAIEGAAGERQLPHRKVMASQAVISGFTDPVVANDPVNTKNMIYGLANLSSKGKAFTNNPDAPEAQRVYKEQANKYLDSTLAYLETEMRMPRGQLMRAQRVPGGGIEWQRTMPGSIGPNSAKLDRAISILNRDMNAALVAWAHLNGSELSDETTSMWVAR